jgi:hypothetical protein
MPISRLIEPAINICQELETSGDTLISTRRAITDPTAQAMAATISPMLANAEALVRD